jgi:D-beta-D-heptose 7-phosphate kinase/D-beta-D-heptose 1-phosphate adenosyltransferase
MSISTSKAKVLLRKVRSLRILVIGDVMLDHYIWGDATRISPEAPVPVIDVSRDSWTAGGAANVAINLACLGARTTVAGYVGADDAGAKLRSVLKERGVSVIATPGTGSSILKTRVMVQHQQLCRIDRESPPSAYRLSPKDAARILGRAIGKFDAVILSDYAKGILDDTLVATATRLAREKGTFIALDPKPKHALAFSDLDLITPNKREALQLAGIEPVHGEPFPTEKVCRKLHERYGTRNLVVTLGEDGMLLSKAGRILRTIPTAAREVYDVSGAGDTALAALVLALTAGAQLELAAHFANAAAGVVVGKLGTATVTPAELLDYISKAS